MAHQQQQQLSTTSSATAYQDEWPVYPQLKWGHELCPSPQRRPFASFRNCRQPIPPPRRKSAAERAHEVQEQAWVDRQIYITNLPGRHRSSVVFGSESESESGSDQEETQVVEEQPSRHLESMVTKSLMNTRNLVLEGMDVIVMLLNWFYHFVIVLAIVLLLASALQDPSRYFFKRLMLLFVDDPEPEEFYYVSVQNYRSWSVAQPC
ncbi:hypothetical protein PG985_009069 [Apiospora marii]|uniref:Uncharacterized protein n=1 Tax=Apiospora marii TaxID=335849 RepID=A0ABR1RB21_9PEZI